MSKASSDGQRQAPVAIDPRIFRDVLGHLPTGVTVITGYDEHGEPTGMSCNSFTSVSLEPPLVLFCPAKGSTTWPRIVRSGRFCVNVMATEHEETVRTFSRRGVDRFERVAWHERSGGPGLADAVAWIDCVIDTCHEAGDHLIVVAGVVGLEARPNTQPLIFFRGRYVTCTTSETERNHGVDHDATTTGENHGARIWNQRLGA